MGVMIGSFGSYDGDKISVGFYITFVVQKYILSV